MQHIIVWLKKNRKIKGLVVFQEESRPGCACHCWISRQAFLCWRPSFKSEWAAVVTFLFNACPGQDASALSYSSSGKASAAVGEVHYRPPTSLCFQHLQQSCIFLHFYKYQTSRPMKPQCCETVVDPGYYFPSLKLLDLHFLQLYMW